MMKIVSLLVLVFMLYGCSGSVKAEHCLPRDLDYSFEELDSFGSDVVKDMSIMQPNYDWSYYTIPNTNCITVKGVILK